MKVVEFLMSLYNGNDRYNCKLPEEELEFCDFSL